MKNIHWPRLLGCIVAAELIGNIGSFATFSQITTWYATLTKPAFNPPNWLFGPVWTILFALLGIAFYLIWKAEASRKDKTRAYVLFGIQFALNVLWSFVFFRWHEIGWAVGEICLMWLFIVATIFAFAKISRTAAWLLVPYLAWVTFATILNYAIWTLN